MAKRRESRWVKAITVAVVRPTLAAVTRHQWRGAHNVPREGGVIIAANHLSMADPLTIAHFLYVDGGRWPTFTAKEAVFRIPVVRAVATKTGQIPVKRGSTDAVKALQAAEEALAQDGAAVIVYPEGTCTRDPNLWPMVGKTGVARLALTTGVPVVPLAHWGEQHLLRYGTKRIHPFPPKRVRLTAGPPVDLSTYADQPLSATVLKNATDDIMRAITELQAGIRGEEAPAEPFDPRHHRREARAAGDGAADDVTDARPAAGNATEGEA